MASSNFRIKSDNEWNTIFYRFKQGKQFDIEASIGIQAPKGRWSEAKQEILTTNLINAKATNAKLKEFDIFLRKEFESTKLAEEAILINTKWLKSKIDFFFNRETDNEEENEKLFLTAFIDSYIKEARSKKTKKNQPLSKRTIQHYTTTLTKLEAFEEHIGQKVKLSDINLKFHSNFINFLETKQDLNPNTIGGYIDNIKLFCKNCENRGYTIPHFYKLQEFYSPSNTTNDIYLKEEEVNTIYTTKFEQDYLDNARDWFIIGLRTGLRISDFLNLSQKNIVDGFFEIETKKTGFPVIIPIHQQIQEILKKRNGQFPRQISDQKFNKYIKKVAEIAGLNEIVDGAKLTEITQVENGKKTTKHRKTSNKFHKHELVSSHICRRTFATNLYGKLDTLTIMKITGHQTEKQFLAYIKITPKEYAIKLKEYWKTINPEAI